MDGRLHCAVSNDALSAEVHQRREVATKDVSGLGGSHSRECHSVGCECSQCDDLNRNISGGKERTSLTYGFFNWDQRLQETKPENHLVQLDLIGFFETENDDVDGCGIIGGEVVIATEVHRVSRELPYAEITNSCRKKTMAEIGKHPSNFSGS